MAFPTHGTVLEVASTRNHHLVATLVRRHADPDALDLTIGDMQRAEEVEILDLHLLAALDARDHGAQELDVTRTGQYGVAGSGAVVVQHPVRFGRPAARELVRASG